MAQNTDNEEILIHFAGPGSAKASQQVWRGNIAVRGEVKQVAKYLGNLRATDGRTRPNIDKHIGAAQQPRQAWFSHESSQATPE